VFAELCGKIALKLGQPPNDAAITINAAAVATAVLDETEDQQARQDVGSILAGITVREVEARLALAAAQYPIRPRLPKLSWFGP
jgi:hypothetical protein